MVEYVKWCNSVEDLAFGRGLSVSLRTLRYSVKKLSKICRFLAVKGKQLSNTVFFIFKVSPVLGPSLKYLKFSRNSSPLQVTGSSCEVIL